MEEQVEEVVVAMQVALPAIVVGTRASAITTTASTSATVGVVHVTSWGMR